MSKIQANAQTSKSEHFTRAEEALNRHRTEAAAAQALSERLRELPYASKIPKDCSEESGERFRHWLMDHDERFYSPRRVTWAIQMLHGRAGNVIDFAGKTHLRVVAS